MSHENKKVLASDELMPWQLLDYIKGRDDELEESGSDLGDIEEEGVEDKLSEPCTPLSDFGGPGTCQGSGGELDFIGVSQPMSPPAPPSQRLIQIRRMTSPVSPRPVTSRDSENLAPLVEEDAFRSRSSPLPGTSRDSLTWKSRENEDEDVIFQEELLEGCLEEGGGGALELAGMSVEMDVVDPIPRLNESVGSRRQTRGLRPQGVCTQGASLHRGRRATTYAVSDERGCQGEPLIDACATEADISPRLREVIDDVHDHNVRREQHMSRRVFKEDDDSDSDYDPDSEQGLFAGDSAALNFDWCPIETFQGSQEQFLPETTGPFRNYSDAYDAFRAYWDDDIMQHIVVETNRYAASIASRSAQFATEWIDTNVDEIMILFAFWMLLGIHKMPTINSCFSQHSVLKTDLFTRLFTQRRYSLLNRALHFVDNSSRTPQSSRLFSIGPMIEHLQAKFMNLYMPGQDISIEETLTLWKGNLGFKQYISTKAARISIKTFELCEVATGYLWAFNVYTGNDTSVSSSSSLPKSTKAVLDLVIPLLNKGHRLFMDNRFNSPILARYLKRNRTDCVGTLQKNRRNVPRIIQHATLPRGHFIARHAGDVVVMAYQEKKTVYTISTCHGVDMVQASARPGSSFFHKPAVIADYNHSMGGVDMRDQMLEPYLVDRKRCLGWLHKLFKRLLNDSILNSRILLQQSILLQRSSADQSQHLVFRVDLVDQIIKRHLSQVPQPRLRQVSNKIPGLSAERLIDAGCHFPVRLGDRSKPLTSGNRTSKNRGLCMWCRVREKRYSKTVYMCERCGVFLCINDCFKNYHTLAD